MYYPFVCFGEAIHVDTLKPSFPVSCVVVVVVVFIVVVVVVVVVVAVVVVAVIAFLSFFFSFSVSYISSSIMRVLLLDCLLSSAWGVCFFSVVLLYLQNWLFP